MTCCMLATEMRKITTIHNSVSLLPAACRTVCARRFFGSVLAGGRRSLAVHAELREQPRARHAARDRVCHLPPHTRQRCVSEPSEPRPHRGAKSSDRGCTLHLGPSVQGALALRAHTVALPKVHRSYTTSRACTAAQRRRPSEAHLPRRRPPAHVLPHLPRAV